MKNFIHLVFVPLLFLSGFTSAQAPDFAVYRISFYGNGCAPGGKMTAAVSADGSTITVLFNTTQNLASFGPNIPASENLKKCQVVVQLAYDDRTYYNKVVASKLEGRTVLEYGVIATIDQSVVYDNNIQLDRFETISLGGPTHDPVSIFQYNGSFAESPKGYYPFQSSTLHVLDIFNLTGAADRAGNIGSGEPFKQIITLEWGLINDTATV